MQWISTAVQGAECSASKLSKFSLPYRLNADLSVLFEASTEDHATKPCTEKPASWQADTLQALNMTQTYCLRDIEYAEV